MLIPWNTDAPIFHWPYGTVGLIVVNWVVFAAMVSTGFDEPSWINEYALVYGDGLHPVQWVTSNFMHAGFLHLLGNMIFLWGFGIVVEGKIGWQRFLAVYLGMAVTQSAAEQILLLGHEGGASLGASAAIYGVLAMAMVWAPENEMECILLLGIRAQMVELRIYTLAMLYIAFEFIMAAFSGFAFGSAVIHLSGAAIGFAVGTIMLKKGWVECDGWDVYAKWGGRLGETQPEKKPDVDRDEVRRQAELKRQGQLDLLRQLIAEGKPLAAQETYAAQMGKRDAIELPEPDLHNLIAGLHAEEAWELSLPLMVECLKRFPAHAVQMRLKLAEILIDKESRPQQALRVLRKLDGQALPDPLASARARLEQKAEAIAEDAEIELQSEDW